MFPKENPKWYTEDVFLDSSMVEHSAVNRGVVGSSPTRGAEGKTDCSSFTEWLHGQVVKTPPFHGGNMGSSPVGVTESGFIIGSIADP